MDLWDLKFPRNKDAFELHKKVPMSEAAAQIQIGDCSVCGEDAAEKGRGIIKDPEVVRGVMTGTVICIDCALADPEIDIDELDAD